MGYGSYQPRYCNNYYCGRCGFKCGRYGWDCGRYGFECGPSGVGPFWICKAVVDLSGALLEWGRCGFVRPLWIWVWPFWPLWIVAFMDCGRYGVGPLWIEAVLVWGRCAWGRCDLFPFKYQIICILRKYPWMEIYFWIVTWHLLTNEITL